MGTPYKFAEAALAALQTGSKCSFTPCKLRFFARLRLAIIGLIEFYGSALISNFFGHTKQQLV